MGESGCPFLQPGPTCGGLMDISLGYQAVERWDAAKPLLVVRRMYWHAQSIGRRLSDRQETVWGCATRSRLLSWWVLSVGTEAQYDTSSQQVTRRMLWSTLARRQTIAAVGNDAQVATHRPTIYISFVIAHNSSYPGTQAISYDASTRLDDSGVKSQVAKLISSLSHARPDTADHTSLHLGALGSIAVYSRYVITKRARWRPSAACRPSPPRSALSSRRGGQRRRVRASESQRTATTARTTLSPPARRLLSAAHDQPSCLSDNPHPPTASWSMHCLRPARRIQSLSSPIARAHRTVRPIPPRRRDERLRPMLSAPY